MFPFDLEDEDIDVEELEEQEQITDDYEIDFTTGKLTGNMVTGADAVKQWVLLVLATRRYAYMQYSWDYGTELEELVGQNFEKDYIESEVYRMLTDAFSINEEIEGICDLVCDMEKDRLTVSFTLLTLYGEVEVDSVYV